MCYVLFSGQTGSHRFSIGMMTEPSKQNISISFVITSLENPENSRTYRSITVLSKQAMDYWQKLFVKKLPSHWRKQLFLIEVIRNGAKVAQIGMDISHLWAEWYFKNSYQTYYKKLIDHKGIWHKTTSRNC